MRPQSRPQLRQLKRVIPIAQSQQHDEILVTLLALEVYADGCVITTLLQAIPEPGIPLNRFGVAWFTVTFRDDLGTSYSGTLCGSSSSSRGGCWQGRAACECTPTLDPGARKIWIDIAALRWERWQGELDGEGGLTPGETTLGPWRFTVAVTDISP